MPSACTKSSTRSLRTLRGGCDRNDREVSPRKAETFESVASDMTMKPALHMIGPFLLAAVLLSGIGTDSLVQIRAASAGAQEGCDSCSLRHQAFTRTGDLRNEESVPPADVSFGYKIANAIHQLGGRLYRPEAEEPAPAVVILHACAGVRPLQHEWARRFQAWGYVALVLDNTAPHGTSSTCEEAKSEVLLRGHGSAKPLDAYAASAYLSMQAFVNAERIGHVGWQEARPARKAVADEAVGTGSIDPRASGFTAVVAFNRSCPESGEGEVSLLIRTGKAGTWQTAPPCRKP